MENDEKKLQLIITMEELYEQHDNVQVDDDLLLQVGMDEMNRIVSLDLYSTTTSRSVAWHTVEHILFGRDTTRARIGAPQPN